MAHVDPHGVMAKKKEKEVLKARIKAAFLDSFFIFYSLLVVDRIIWSRFIMQVKDVPFSWGEIGIFALVSILAGVAWSMSGTSLSARLFGLARPTKTAKLTFEIFAWFLFNITFIAGWIITKISIVDLFSDEGVTAAQRIFTSLFTPQMAIFDEALFAIIETIYIALIATLVSIPITLVISFLSARNLMNDNRLTLFVYGTLRLISNFVRSIEPLIWAIIFSVWIGIGPYAGMLALLIHTIASNAKLYSEAIESIEEGPVEAISATGANKLQVIWYAVVPQIILPFLSFTIYRWDINVRMATIIGMVGGGGIGTMLIQYQGLAQWHEVGLIVIMIALVVWIMDYISTKIRQAIY